MENKITVPKKVCAIHDLAGFGRCSFSVILPVLAAMGVQPCALPTAVLSTHTGGFDDYTFVDFTDSMVEYFQHWKKLDIKFDAVYSGFLGNEKQISIVSDIIDAFKEKDTVIMVDPVMGDDGKLYSTYNTKLQNGMKSLIKKATVITPNITEACFLLDVGYKEEHTQDEINSYLDGLADYGAKQIVITGIRKNEEIHTAFLDTESKERGLVSETMVKKGYPGTGDIFASILLGGILKGKSLEASVRSACDFVYFAIKYSSNIDYPVREGVLLEGLLRKILEYE